MQQSKPPAHSPASVFSLDGIPPAGQLVPLGLQHVVAAVVGIITPAIMVANTCALSDADRTLLIQVSLIVTALATLLAIGDLSSTTMGGMDRMPTDKELSGGIIAQGVVSVIGALFGGLPAATYSQNVGIVTVNKVINKAVFAFASLVLLVARLVPKLSAILTTIPQAVIGGATISVFGSSPIVVTAIVAILLNLTLPKDQAAKSGS